MKFPPRCRSTTLCSSRCSASTPVSRTATTMLRSPLVEAHAPGTCIRLSSHWRMPSGFVTPRNDGSSCQGSGKEPPVPPSLSGARPPPCSFTSPRSLTSSASWKAPTTAEFRRIRSAKPSVFEAAARAPIWLMSLTTTPPAEETAERICAGGVPGAKRTTVIPNGFAADAEPAKASAPQTAARRRPGRFTMQSVSAPRPKSSITRSGRGKGPPKRPLFLVRVCPGELPPARLPGEALPEHALAAVAVAVGKPDVVREDVLVVRDAVQRERIGVPRVGPDRVRLVTTVHGQPAVVAVEPGLDSVRRREGRREHPEAVRGVVAAPAREHVVGILLTDSRLDARRERRAVGRAEPEEATHVRVVLARDASRPVVAGAVPVAVLRALVGGGEVVVES